MAALEDVARARADLAFGGLRRAKHGIESDVAVVEEVLRARDLERSRGSVVESARRIRVARDLAVTNHIAHAGDHHGD